jgi:hypothetical protein
MAANPDVDDAILEAVAQSGTVMDPTAGVDGEAFTRIQPPRQVQQITTRPADAC